MSPCLPRFRGRKLFQNIEYSRPLKIPPLIFVKVRYFRFRQDTKGFHHLTPKNVIFIVVCRWGQGAGECHVILQDLDLGHWLFFEKLRVSFFDWRLGAAEPFQAYKGPFSKQLLVRVWCGAYFLRLNTHSAFVLEKEQAQFCWWLELPLSGDLASLNTRLEFSLRPRS